jgi:hypothetical protein
MDDLAGKKTLVWPGIDIDIPQIRTVAIQLRMERRTVCLQLSRWRPGGHSFTQILRDEARKPERGRRRCARTWMRIR